MKVASPSRYTLYILGLRERLSLKGRGRTDVAHESTDCEVHHVEVLHTKRLRANKFDA